MNTYKVTILRNGDKSLPYIITVSGMSQEDAIIRAKNFVAENGYWSRNMSIADRIKRLSADHIEIRSTNITSTV